MKLSTVSVDKGGGLRRFLDFMGWALGIKARVDKKKIITAFLVRIEASAQEIRETITRLELRYQSLLKKAVSAMVKKENDRALIYANEAAQVKSIYRKLTVVDKVLEQIKLRLETIENMSNIQVPMVEVTNILSVVRDYIKDVVPSMASSIDTLINESKRVLVETTDSIEIDPEKALETTPEARKLLEDLEKTVAETVNNRLPDIPVSLLSPRSKSLEVKVKETAIKVPVAPRPRIRKPRPEEIDREVLEYILTHGGFIDVGDLAAKLGVGKSVIRESLYRLREQNKIKF
ncbi:MAG: GntR family transcriptional regulator [Desulfurococcales archaeon]|nr:GntR family transcriptional regulator [Desulfurococcales archaeon]